MDAAGVALQLHQVSAAAHFPAEFVADGAFDLEWKLRQDLAEAGLGMKVEGEFSGGCADSGFTAGVGCPTLCSVGPVGGNAHTVDEYLEIASLVPRAQALALTILGLAETN